MESICSPGIFPNTWEGGVFQNLKLCLEFMSLLKVKPADVHVCSFYFSLNVPFSWNTISLFSFVALNSQKLTKRI